MIKAPSPGRRGGRGAHSPAARSAWSRRYRASPRSPGRRRGAGGRLRRRWCGTRPPAARTRRQPAISRDVTPRLLCDDDAMTRLQHDVLAALLRLEDLERLGREGRRDDPVAHLLLLLCRRCGGGGACSCCARVVVLASILRSFAVSMSTSSLTATKSPNEHSGSACTCTIRRDCECNSPRSPSTADPPSASGGIRESHARKFDHSPSACA